MITVTLKVPDVAARWADGFRWLRVYRAPTPQGTYQEITAPAALPATLTAPTPGAYNLADLTFNVTVDRGAPVAVTLAGTNPLATLEVMLAVNAAVPGVTTADVSGALSIVTDSVGSSASLEVTGDSMVLDLLGWTSGDMAAGKSQRVRLVENQTSYCFQDHQGDETFHYRFDLYDDTGNVASEIRFPCNPVVPTVPKAQAESRAPRGLTLVRKTSHVFRNAFFQDEAETVPVTPLDASRYPAYQVVDIKGQVIQAGTATLDGQPGHYRVELFIPADAPLSNDDRRYRLEWVMLDQDGRQFEKTTEFDVRDVEATTSETQQHRHIALCDQPYRMLLRLSRRPYSIRLDVADPSGNSPVATNVVWPGNGDPEEATLTEVVDGETYVYWYDIPEGVLQAARTYQAIFQTRETVGSQLEHQFQILDVPPTMSLQYFPSLRMCIDKYQKRRDQIQAYQDSDVYEYLTQGLSVLNAWHPLTSFQMNTLPQPLTPYWLMLAQVWALNAQFLLETDLQFSFSGQEISLDYDHTGNIDSALQRALDFVREGLGPAKLAVYRRQAGVGVFAGRGYRLSGLHNYVYPVASYSSTDFATLLSKMGLL